MALTVAKVVQILNRRVGPWAALADPGEAVAYAMDSFAVAYLDRTAISDAELALAANVNGLLDVAEWRMIEGVLNNISEAELLKAGVSEDADKVASRLRMRASELWARISKSYQLGVSPAVLGYLTIPQNEVDDPSVPPFLVP